MASANRLLLFSTPLGCQYDSAGSFTNFAIDAAAKRVAAAFLMPEAATVTHLGFRYGARTGTPPTYRVSLQSPGADGSPDGTVLGGASPASATFTPPADATWNGTWQWVALSNSYAATRGQPLALVVDHSAGTADASNNSSFSQYSGGWAAGNRSGLPVSSSYGGAAWARVSQGVPVYGLKSASAVYGNPIESGSVTAATVVGRRVACKFTLPAGWGDTFTVAGARVHGMPCAAAGFTYKFGLWGADGAEIQAATLDSDLAVSAGSAARSYELYFDEASLTALSFGTAYYLGFECLSASNPPEINYTAADANAELAAWPHGASAVESSWDGAAWADSDARRPAVEPILADWSEPAGSGGQGVAQGLQGLESGVCA